jgi:hypothetical protein
MAAPATERAQAPRIPRASLEKANRAVIGPATAALIAAPSRGGDKRDLRRPEVGCPRPPPVLGRFGLLSSVPAARRRVLRLIAADQYVADFAPALSA